MILCSLILLLICLFPLKLSRSLLEIYHISHMQWKKIGAWSWASLLFVAGVGSLALLNLVPPDYENKMFQIGLILTLKALFTSELGDKTKGFYNFKIKGMALKGFRKISSMERFICQWPCAGQSIEHRQLYFSAQ